jgi:hypothetical protein
MKKSRWAGLVAGFVNMRNAYKTLIEKKKNCMEEAR